MLLALAFAVVLAALDDVLDAVLVVGALVDHALGVVLVVVAVLSVAAAQFLLAVVFSPLTVFFSLPAVVDADPAVLDDRLGSAGVDDVADVAALDPRRSTAEIQAPGFDFLFAL